MTDEFLEAIRSGDAARVNELLDEDSSLAECRDGSVSAVLLAAYHGRGAIARAIAARRASLTLAEACAIGDAEVALRLIEADPAAIDQAGDDGHYPVGLAIFFGHPDLARLLIDRGAEVRLHSQNAQSVTPLHAAAAVCDHEMIRLLLDRGADPNARQELGYAPLHTAGARGDGESAKLLLASGAIRDAKGIDGKTPADVAREHGQEAFAVWLESAEE